MHRETYATEHLQSPYVWAIVTVSLPHYPGDEKNLAIAEYCAQARLELPPLLSKALRVHWDGSKPVRNPPCDPERDPTYDAVAKFLEQGRRVRRWFCVGKMTFVDPERDVDHAEVQDPYQVETEMQPSFPA